MREKTMDSTTALIQQPRYMGRRSFAESRQDMIGDSTTDVYYEADLGVRRSDEAATTVPIPTKITFD